MLLVFTGIAAVTILFGLNLFFFLRTPHLESIDPDQARSGDIVVLSGRFLGAPEPGNSLNVGGQRITSSYILEWERDRISFRIPEGLSSGDVIVELPQGRSNPLLFTNIDSIPRPVNTGENPEIQASLAESGDESLWLVRVTGVDFGELSSAGWYWDDMPLPRSRRVFVREGTDEQSVPEAGQSPPPKTHVVGIHLPLYEYFPSFRPGDQDGGDIDDQDIREELSAIESEVSRRLSFSLGSLNFSSAEDAIDDRSALFQLRNGNGIWENTLYSRRGRGTEAAASEDEALLYSLSLSIDIPRTDPSESPGELPPSQPEYILTLPLPEVQNHGYELQGNFRGYIQALPSAGNIPAFRLLPGGIRERRKEGNLILHIYGRALQPSAPVPGLLYGNDDFSQAEVFLPLYEEYLAFGDRPLLDSDLRQEMLNSIASSRGALPLARGIYEWLSLQDMGGIEAITIFIDELRRLGIPARERRGYVRIPGETGAQNGGFKVTSWAEFFLPRWGWVPVYREALQEDAPFSSVGAEYLPVPLGQPFPRLETLNSTTGTGRLTTRLLTRH